MALSARPAMNVMIPAIGPPAGGPHLGRPTSRRSSRSTPRRVRDTGGPSSSNWPRRLGSCHATRETHPKRPPRIRHVGRAAARYVGERVAGGRVDHRDRVAAASRHPIPADRLGAVGEQRLNVERVSRLSHCHGFLLPARRAPTEGAGASPDTGKWHAAKWPSASCRAAAPPRRRRPAPGDSGCGSGSRWADRSGRAARP